MRGDLIEMYKILRGIARIDAANILICGNVQNKGDSFRICGYPSQTERRRNYFSQRFMILWNSLPQEELVNIIQTEMTIKKTRGMVRMLESNVEAKIILAIFQELVTWSYSCFLCFLGFYFAAEKSLLDLLLLLPTWSSAFHELQVIS